MRNSFSGMTLSKKKFVSSWSINENFHFCIGNICNMPLSADDLVEVSLFLVTDEIFVTGYGMTSHN